MRNTIKYNRGGFALVLSLLTISVLLVLTIPYVSRVVTDYELTSKIYNSTIALNLAEAGAERAFYDSSFSGLDTLDNLGEYYVERSVSASGTPIIKATGYVPNKLSYKTKRTVKITYVKQPFRKVVMSSGGGAGAITLGTQDKIDSYNSDNGTYAKTHTNSHGDIATNGSIVFGNQAKVYGDANPGASYPFPSKPSNVSGAWGTLPAPLALDPIPQTVLDGNVVTARSSHPNNANIQRGNPADPWPVDSNNNLHVGTQKTITLPGGTPTTPAVYYFTSITLDTQATINIPSGTTIIYVDKAATNGGNINVGTQGAINLGGTTTIYMNHGNSTKSGDINVGTQGDLNINGKSTFYVDGGNINVSTQGDINTSTQIPKNLVVYSSGLNVGLTTQTDFFGAIYAPNAAVSLTTQGEIFGAVACKTISAGTQAAIHFDLALLNISNGLNVFDPFPGVTSWQESQS